MSVRTGCGDGNKSGTFQAGVVVIYCMRTKNADTPYLFSLGKKSTFKKHFISAETIDLRSYVQQTTVLAETCNILCNNIIMRSSSTQIE